MSEQDNELQLVGIVRASRYDTSFKGKGFLGAKIECSDGKKWVIAYDEQSPFHAFADRQVVVSGRPYKPGGQHLLGIEHFRVSTMRLAELTPDAELVEVGLLQKHSGRFERSISDTGKSTLSFVAENGDIFLVANDPAGATVGRSVEVGAYPVQLSPSIRRLPGQYLWIVCPYSAAVIWEWRRQRNDKHGYRYD